MSGRIEWTRPAAGFGVRGMRVSIARLLGARVELRRYDTMGVDWSVSVPRWGIEARLPGASGATTWPVARRMAVATLEAILTERLDAVKGGMP